MFGFGKPKKGQNIVTKGKNVIHAFDPFKEQTTTNTKESVEIRIQKKAHLGQVKWQRFQFEGGDVNRILITTEMKKSGASRDMAQFTEIIFNIDETKNLRFKEVFQNFPTGDTNRNCFVIDSANPDEDMKSILNADNLEIRITTRGNYYVDLSNKEEKKIQKLGLDFYNEVYG